MRRAVSIVVHEERRDSPLLSATLASLEQQTFRDFDVSVIADPPGGDGGEGAASARAAALASAQGFYVIEVNEGDVLRSTMVEKCVWAMETRPNVGVLIVRGSPTLERVSHLRASAVARWVRHGGPQGILVLRTAALDRARDRDGFVHADALTLDIVLDLLGRGWGAAELIGDVIALPDDGQPTSRRRVAQPLRAESATWIRSRHRGTFARARLASAWDRAWSVTAARVPAARSFAERVADKFKADGISSPSQFWRNPVDTALRMMPGRIKTGLWKRWHLPRRPDPWNDAPALVDLPRPIAGYPPRPVDPRMQVLILHSYLIAGGAESLLLRLLARIDHERFAMHLITTEPPPGRLPESPWLPRFAEHADSVYQLHGFLEPSFHLRFLLDFVDSRAIDVVLVSLSTFGYHALPTLRARCPNVATVDLTHSEAPYHPMDHIRLAERYRHSLHRRVVVSESLRHVQVDKYGEEPGRVVVIPNGVDTSNVFDPSRHAAGAFRRRVSIGDGTKIVLFFGRLSDEKQPRQILEVAHRLAARSDLMFVIVGEGPERVALEAEIRARRLANVKLCGRRDDIADALADAELTFFPSKREGLPMSGVEALSMGVPIVAARVPGWTDLIVNGTEGLLVSDGDIDGYVHAITRVADDPELRARMSRAGREKAVRCYDEETWVRRWEELFHSMQSVREHA